MFNAQVSDADNSNPWVTQYLGSTVPPSAASLLTLTTWPPKTAGQYCTESLGFPCLVSLLVLCNPAIVVGPGRVYSLNTSALSCTTGCLAGICYVSEHEVVAASQLKGLSWHNIRTCAAAVTANVQHGQHPTATYDANH
jgi:hypothetical protein